MKKTSAGNAVQLNVGRGILTETKAGKHCIGSILRTDLLLAVLQENQICMSSCYLENKNCKTISRVSLRATFV